MINHMQPEDVEHGRLTEGIRPAACPLSREWFGDDLAVRSLGRQPPRPRAVSQATGLTRR